MIDAVQQLIIPYIRAADEEAQAKHTGHGLSVRGGGPRTSLVEYHNAQKLEQLMNIQLPGQGQGHDGLLKAVRDVLQYSVNTWDQGFLSKLYASTDAVGIVSEMLLAVLNTNVHVYQVSPALTLIEKTASRALAKLFGLSGPQAGGISVQGGSASNITSIVVARNTLFPDTKVHGNGASDRKLVLFTSDDGHYSIAKAAQMLGLGSSAVWSVRTDPDGRMQPSMLRARIEQAHADGFTPFYVNATAGTTVLGSFDPIPEIAAICRAFRLWLHIDASWGGPVIFSAVHAGKMAGSHLADSIAINPHKMMGVPVTCSFLLAADLRQFHRANTLPAAYLFHADDDADADAPAASSTAAKDAHQINDLADLTLQCGRRGDALKLVLGWIFHGAAGYGAQVDAAFATAAYLADRVGAHANLALVSANPPPCLQLCFYYAPGPDVRRNSATTVAIARRLVPDGFLVDYAPGPRGTVLRVVVHRGTRRETVDGLLVAVERAGREIGGGMEGVEGGGV